MYSKDAIQLFEKYSCILKKISDSYDESSAEHAALKCSAYALAYSLVENHRDFVMYIMQSDSELSSEEREDLRKLLE